MEESCGETNAQVKLSREQEIELVKLKQDLNAANAKHLIAFNKMEELIDQLQKNKAQSENERLLKDNAEKKRDELSCELEMFRKTLEEGNIKFVI